MIMIIIFIIIIIIMIIIMIIFLINDFDTIFEVKVIVSRLMAQMSK